MILHKQGCAFGAIVISRDSFFMPPSYSPIQPSSDQNLAVLPPSDRKNTKISDFYVVKNIRCLRGPKEPGYTQIFVLLQF